MATITISNELLTTTGLAYIEEVTDQLGVANPLTARCEKLYGKGKPVEVGGNTIIVPLGWTEHSVTTAYENGFEEEAGDAQEATVPAQYNWFFASRPIQISWTEAEMNTGEKQIIDILEARLAAATGGLMREFHKQTVAGGVASFTAPATRKAGTLNGVTHATGYLEGAARASQTHTVGGVGKTGVYAAGKLHWANQFYDVSGAFSTNGLPAMDDMTVEANSLRTGEKDGAFWLVNKAWIKNQKRALRANERYTDEKMIDGGRLVLAWDGADVEYSEYVPANISYLLDLREIYPTFLGDNYYKLTDFVDGAAGGYLVKRASLKLAYQLVAKSLAGSGMAINGDTY